MATADEKRGKELAELARQFFLWLRDHELPGISGFKGRPPTDFKMNAGIYRKVKGSDFTGGGAVLQFWDDPEEQRRLRSVNLGVRHALLYANREEWSSPIGSDEIYEQNEVYFTGDGDIEKVGALGVTMPALDSVEADADTLGTWSYTTFSGLIGRADMVFDDPDEAIRIGFKKKYRWIFDYDAPRHAYEGNVRDIVPIELGEGLTEFREYLYWYATYEEREKARHKGGQYYNKWKAKLPLKKHQREFRPTQLSTTYLKESFHEMVLQKNRSYVMLDLEGLLVVYKLTLVPATGSKPAKLKVKLVLNYQDLTYLGTQEAVDIITPIRSVVFHALDGGSDLPKKMKDRGHAELGGTASGRYAYDYKQAVRWFLDDDHVDLGTDADWFHRFVDLLFPDAVYPVDGRPDHAADSTLTIDELLAQADGATGTIGDHLDEIRALAANSPSVRYVVKGAYYGQTEAGRRQLIGVSKDMVYEWYPVTGLVTRMALSAWYRDNYLGKVAAQVYESTKGMIPFMMVVSFGGIIVAGGAIVGAGAVLANLARDQIRRLAQDAIAKRLTKELIRKFRAQLIALVADGLLGLMPRTDSVLFELLRGFVHGFGAGAIEHYFGQIDERMEKQVKKLYKKALNKVTGGVDKVYRVYLKLSAAYTKLAGVFHALQAVWTPQFAEVAGMALVLVGRNLAIGLIVSVFVLAYVDYISKQGTLDQAKRDAWVKSQRDALKFMIKETGADIAAHAEAMREDLAGTPPIPNVIRERNDRLAMSIANAVMKAPTEAPGVMEIFREILEELGIDNWKELTELGLLELIARGYDVFKAAHPDFEARGARVLGEALGELIGTIFLERAMLPKRWRKDKISGNRPIDKSIRKVLAGGTAPALWKFARVPLDELRKLIAMADDPLPDIPSDTPGVFERVQHDDTMYRDLLRDLLTHDRELGDSLGRLALDETLPDRIRAMVDLAATESPPDIESVLDADDVSWPRDAVLFVLQTWLRVAITQLLRAFDVLEDDEPFDGKFRLSTLLEIAGIEVSLDDKIAAQLAVQFERAF